MPESIVNTIPEHQGRPRIGITIGDPAGIGPEVSLKAVADAELSDLYDPVLIGDARYLQAWAEKLNLVIDPVIIKQGNPIPHALSGLAIYDLENIDDSVEMGCESASSGRASAEYVEVGARLCLGGELHGMTTAPISKKALSLAGIPFPGHTEFLAHLSDSDDFAMAFIAPTLRVALLTTHVSLAQVPSLVKKADLERLIRLVDRELRRYGIARPRIAVAGINPHAGEGGLFGSEEALEMKPAIEACRREGDVEVSGPYPGDTIFARAIRGEFDIVISCYHDQGLIPIKCVSFGESVNVTLGLPFIRTSVDHGTAFDIAGKGVADHSSMVAAIRLAIDLYRQRAAGSIVDRA
ncbi:MAG: 4-hydroxythreonine-4-phosphate dehydrogenase PdxA [Acidobacteriota bacterium]